MNPPRRAPWLAAACVAGALGLAGLACATPGTGPDAAATVEALNQQVAATLAAQTAVPTGLPANTPLPTTKVWPATVTAPAPASPVPPTPQPTPWPTFVAPPTSTPLPTPSLPPTPSATPTDVARSNGPLLRVAFAPVGPTIDGTLGEWNALPFYFDTPVYKHENWVGPADNSVSFSLVWNQRYLFLAALVTDDYHVQTQQREMMYQGDSLEILFDADLAGDFATQRLTSDDLQLGLSPGALNGDQPQAWLWFPASLSGAATTVALSAAPEGQGYRLEAAIPWALFNVTPAGNQRFGFVLSASDNDVAGTAEQQSLITSQTTRKLTDPTTWGTLVLDPP